MQSILAYYSDDGNDLREVKIDGAVIAMPPAPTIPHLRISANLTRLFSNYLWTRTCDYFPDSPDVHLDEKNVFRPDGCVVCDPRKIHTDGIHGAPDLVIEILSPGAAKRDRGIKKDTYAKHGVGEYWLIDPVNAPPA